MRQGFRGFLGVTTGGRAMAAMAMALEFMKATPPPLLRQPSKSNYRYDSRHMRHPHKKEADRQLAMVPFADEYKSNPMNYLPGRDTARLMKIKGYGQMMKAASEALAAYRENGQCLDRVQPRSAPWNN